MQLLRMSLLAAVSFGLTACTNSTQTKPSDATADGSPTDGSLAGKEDTTTPDASSVTNTPSDVTDEPAVDDDTPGIAVGDKAPAFALTNQNGETVSLAELTAAGNVALVFYRSADW